MYIDLDDKAKNFAVQYIPESPGSLLPQAEFSLYLLLAFYLNSISQGFSHKQFLACYIYERTYVLPCATERVREIHVDESNPEVAARDKWVTLIIVANSRWQWIDV